MPDPSPEVVDAVRRVVGRISPPPDPSGQPLTFEDLNERDALENPAIVDVHLLQLAYPELLRGISRAAAYDKAVTVLAEAFELAYGPNSDWSPPFGTPPETAEELDRELDSLLRGESTIADVDELVRKWFPEMDAGLWSWISTTDKDYFVGLALALQEGRQGESAREAGDNHIRNRRSEFMLSDSALPKYLGGYGWNRAKQSVHELRQLLNANYPVDIAAAGSYTFALVGTFRQVWDPRALQVGGLPVLTVPLMPGQTVTRKIIQGVKESSVEKRMESLERGDTSERSGSHRSESELTRKSVMKAGFRNENQTGATVGVVNSSNTMAMQGDVEKESAAITKNLSEAAHKVASELKMSRTYEITDSSEVTSSVEETITFTNTNQELTLTCVFFEVERQYEVSESLHAVTPVILVAREVPDPTEIDEDFAITMEPTLRLFLPEEYLPDLERLIEQPADAMRVALLREQVHAQRAAVRRLEDQLTATLERRRRAREDVLDATRGRAAGGDGLIVNVLEGIFGSAPDDDEQAQAAVEAANRALEMVEGDIAQAYQQHLDASALLRAMVKDLEAAVTDSLTVGMATTRLLAYIKANILPIMQLRWSQEQHDEVWSRLNRLPVDVPVGAHAVEFRSTMDMSSGTDLFDGLFADGESPGALDFDIPLVEVDLEDGSEAPSFARMELGQITNLRSLGFWTNYQIFELTQSNAVTTLMSVQFLGQHLQIWDPDGLQNADIDAIVDALLQRDIDAGAVGVRAHWDVLREEVKRRLSTARPRHQTVVVPWNQLMVDAIPGSHPVLEEFKLKHREVDKRAAETELYLRQLEGLGRADEVLHGDRADRRIRVDRNSDGPITVAVGDPDAEP